MALTRTKPRITRRGVQIALGILWVLDGALQLQPAMFTRQFATDVIAPVGQGQPAVVSVPVAEVARIILMQPVLAGAAFAFIQLAIGVGLFYPRTVRWALGASVVWALAVWYLGEGLGGMLNGSVTLLTGAPGAALLYAVLALAVWPAANNQRADQHPASWLPLWWATLWIIGDVLQMLPGNNTNDNLSMAIGMNASGSLGWLSAIDTHVALATPAYGGISFVVDLVLLQLVIGLGALSRRVRPFAVGAGIVLSALYWVVGQGFGEPWTHLMTDPGTAPLIVLTGLAVLASASCNKTRGKHEARHAHPVAQ